MRCPCPRATTTAAVALVTALALAGQAGCGYHILTPHDRSVRTVYVPLARSNSFRRDLNFMLNERLIKEIERRTPYKVVGSPEGADSTLEITITFADKGILVESPENLPRHLTATLSATVNWVDNRPGVSKERADQPPAAVYESVYFYPELGETAQLGYQKAIDRMSAQIVDMMESNWVGGQD